MKNNNAPKSITEAYTSIYKEDISTEQGAEHTQELITQLLDLLSKGSTFASFMYKSKGLGETALYNVRLNADYKRAKEEDHARLEAYTPEDESEAKAKEHILNLYKNPKARTQKQLDTYTNYGKGIRVNNTTGKLHLFGYKENKDVVADKAEKEDRRGELKKACDNLKKKLNFQNDKIRDFILDPSHIAGFKTQGDLIQFQQDDQGASTGKE
jgi:CRISPR/Cas system CMR-associated protein Cmr1 (group 7 of RAMP superfamily)